MIVSGPSGAGKTTVLRRVFEECRLPLTPSVSATTRSPRPGEQDGVDYHFLAREEFDRRRRAGEFLEACEVYAQGDWYGTLEAEVAPRLAAGKWVVLEIDVQGTLAVVDRHPDAITLFLKPSTPEELERRLRDRGTERPEALARRLEVARRELSAAEKYRYQVVNDDVDAAVEEICRILSAESRTSPQAQGPAR